MTTQLNPLKTGIGAGIITVGCMVLYFFIMKYAGLVQLLELRALNFFILLGGILLALNRYKRSNGNQVSYLEGFGLGLLTTGVTVAVFSAFIGIYLHMNPSFMEFIRGHALMGAYLNPPTVALGILIEGSISGLIISFACMQYFKKFANDHPIS